MKHLPNLIKSSFWFQPGDRVEFLDEIESVRKEAQRLKKEERIEILIALGHSGYELDKQVSKLCRFYLMIKDLKFI